MQTVTISIGRGLPGGGDMDAAQWAAFIDGVRRIIAPRGVVFVDAARSVGEWQGQPEESATFVVGEVTPDGVAGILREAAALSRLFHQDAIAVTAGSTALV